MSSPSKLCLVLKLDLVGLLGHALKEVVRPGDLGEKHDYYRMPDTISILHVLHANVCTYYWTYGKSKAVW